MKQIRCLKRRKKDVKQCKCCLKSIYISGVMVTQNPTAIQLPVICFYLQEGVEILDFAGPMEVFSAAGAKVFTVSKHKNIKSQGILNITTDFDLSDTPPFDMLAVFGGNANVAYNDEEVLQWIKGRKPEIATYFSVCSGAIILAKAGLLAGLTATTYHTNLEKLKQAEPSANVLANTRFVDNGNIITTAGVSAGIDGALHLVQRWGGMDLLNKVIAYMEYDKWQPNGGLVIHKPE